MCCGLGTRAVQCPPKPSASMHSSSAGCCSGSAQSSTPPAAGGPGRQPCWCAGRALFQQRPRGIRAGQGCRPGCVAAAAAAGHCDNPAHPSGGGASAGTLWQTRVEHRGCLLTAVISAPIHWATSAATWPRQNRAFPTRRWSNQEVSRHLPPLDTTLLLASCEHISSCDIADIDAEQRRLTQ